MFLSNSKQNIRDLFEACFFTIEESPLLSSVDFDGPDGSTIYANWHCEEGGGSYSIPHSSLESAQVFDAEIILKDIDGNDCRVTFYENQVITKPKNVYTIIWEHQYGSDVRQVMLPEDVKLSLGFVEPGEIEPVLQEVIDHLKLDVELSAVETLNVTSGALTEHDLSDIF